MQLAWQTGNESKQEIKAAMLGLRMVTALKLLCAVHTVCKQALYVCRWFAGHLQRAKLLTSIQLK